MAEVPLSFAIGFGAVITVLRWCFVLPNRGKSKGLPLFEGWIGRVCSGSVSSLRRLLGATYLSDVSSQGIHRKSKIINLLTE